MGWDGAVSIFWDGIIPSDVWLRGMNSSQFFVWYDGLKTRDGWLG
uniref:Uncharacterized protein n=1 Tax=Setaria viridis TaxID=4556 RepID=A0A4U6SUN8_SETVI|nr:hypothetical protein SEVIR_9G140950v2 [Setaria viridis]